MTKIYLLAIAFFLLGCIEGSDSSEGDEGVEEMEKLVEIYKKIPAFPFQFSYEDLHVDPVGLSKKQQKLHFELEDDVSAKALHYYVLGENYILFTMWNVIPMPANNQVFIQVDMFTKKGEKLGTIAPIPYQYSFRKYKGNPKFEIYEKSLLFVIEEIYYKDEIVDGPADGLADQIEYRSFYSETYETSLNGFELIKPTPFWMKIPRNYFSPFVIDYLRKDGVYDHVVEESENDILLVDRTDAQYRANFHLFDDGLIGISSSFQDESTGQITSTFSMIEIADKMIHDRTDEVLGDVKQNIRELNCTVSTFDEKTEKQHVLNDKGTTDNFPFVQFQGNSIMFYCFDANAKEHIPNLTFRWTNNTLTREN